MKNIWLGMILFCDTLWQTDGCHGVHWLFLPSRDWLFNFHKHLLQIMTHETVKLLIVEVVFHEIKYTS